MRSNIEIFTRFLVLGCCSFGGPAAHVGYFYKTFVEKLQWINDQNFSQLLGLSQFLPGPGSSQLGFAIGLRRNGLSGGISAFIGFTLPSFLIMLLLASFSSQAEFIQKSSGVIHGLKLLAVIVVADAIWKMFHQFCQDKWNQQVAIFSAFSLLCFSGIFTQIIILLIAATLGFFLKKKTKHATETLSKIQIQKRSIFIFLGLLFLLPTTQFFSPKIAIASEFYWSGSYVFGGGHVVLPILKDTVGSSMSSNEFLLGYSAAQAVPGPMFTMATYLGALCTPDSKWIGAILGTFFIFLPGFLLMYAFQGAWINLISNPLLSSISAKINAAVVGLLIAALYQPVATSAIFTPVDMAFVLVGIFLIQSKKIPIFWLVLFYGLIGFLHFS